MPSLYPHEVRKIAEGSEASGFAGFFFPSFRARGLGEEKPVPSYSAIVYKEGDEVRAEDWKGRKIASGEAGVDDANVIQSALDSQPDTYPSKTIRIVGSFIIKDTIKLHSYLNLDLADAILVLADNVDKSVIYGADIHHVSILFGEINCNGAHQSGTVNAINYNGIFIEAIDDTPSNIKIIGTRIINAGHYGISFNRHLTKTGSATHACNDVLVTYCRVINCGVAPNASEGKHGYGISVGRGGLNVRILNNYVSDCLTAGIKTGGSDYDNTRNENIAIAGCTIRNCNRYHIDVAGTRNLIIKDNDLDNPNASIVDAETYALFVESVTPGCIGVKIIDNTIRRGGAYNICVLPNNVDILIEGNTCSKLLNDGIERHIYSGAPCRIINNYIDGSNDAASSYGILVYNTSKVEIIGNKIYNIGARAILLEKAPYSAIIGNIVDTNGGGALIDVLESLASVVKGNIIRNAATFGIVLRGDGIAPDSEYCVVEGNVIEDSGSNGIAEKNACDYNVIVGNALRNCAAGISTVGANTIVANNI